VRVGLLVLLALVVLPVGLNRFGRYFAAEIFTWALYAMGFNICFGMAGMLSFGHAAFFAFGAYGATLTVLHLARDPWLALLAAVVVMNRFGRGQPPTRGSSPESTAGAPNPLKDC